MRKDYVDSDSPEELNTKAEVADDSDLDLSNYSGKVSVPSIIIPQLPVVTVATDYVEPGDEKERGNFSSKWKETNVYAMETFVTRNSNMRSCHVSNRGSFSTKSTVETSPVILMTWMDSSTRSRTLTTTFVSTVSASSPTRQTEFTNGKWKSLVYSVVNTIR